MTSPNEKSTIRINDAEILCDKALLGCVKNLRSRADNAISSAVEQLKFLGGNVDKWPKTWSISRVHIRNLSTREGSFRGWFTVDLIDSWFPIKSNLLGKFFRWVRCLLFGVKGIQPFLTLLDQRNDIFNLYTEPMLRVSLINVIGRYFETIPPAHEDYQPTVDTLNRYLEQVKYEKRPWFWDEVGHAAAILLGRIKPTPHLLESLLPSQSTRRIESWRVCSPLHKLNTGSRLVEAVTYVQEDSAYKVLFRLADENNEVLQHVLSVVEGFLPPQSTPAVAIIILASLAPKYKDVELFLNRYVNKLLERANEAWSKSNEGRIYYQNKPNEDSVTWNDWFDIVFTIGVIGQLKVIDQKNDDVYDIFKQELWKRWEHLVKIYGDHYCARYPTVYLVKAGYGQEMRRKLQQIVPPIWRSMEGNKIADRFLIESYDWCYPSLEERREYLKQIGFNNFEIEQIIADYAEKESKEKKSILKKG